MGTSSPTSPGASVETTAEKDDRTDVQGTESGKKKNVTLKLNLFREKEAGRGTLVRINKFG